MFKENLVVPEQGTEQETQATPESQTQTDPQTGQIVEIDTPDRYRYKGRALNEWESGYMRQQDYTQKTQALALERKFNDNLAIDLDRVRQNPQLSEQFKSVYPEKYHAFLRYALSNSGTPQSQQPQQQQPQGQNYGRLDPATESRLAQLEKNIREKEVSAISTDLDSKFQKLQAEYPHADEEAVVARAQTLLAKLKEQDPLNPDLRITDKQWDILWKTQHDRAYGISDANYKKQIQAQISAHKKGSDTGQGGGLPGQAPRQFKTIKEASEQFHKDIEAGSI